MLLIACNLVKERTLVATNAFTIALSAKQGGKLVNIKFITSLSVVISTSLIVLNGSMQDNYVNA